MKKFKYLSPEWEHVRDILFECKTGLLLGYCNSLASDIVEGWVGPDTDILRIVINNFSLREVPEHVQNEIKKYLITVSN